MLFRSLSDIRNFSKDRLLAMEKEMLGVYLTDHPLNEYKEIIDRYASLKSSDLAIEVEKEESGYHKLEAGTTVADGQQAVMAGIITNIRKLITNMRVLRRFLVD